MIDQPSRASHPALSIIVPCRNEETHIEAFLDSVRAQDLPTGTYECLVVDGRSDDHTRAILEVLARRMPFELHVVDNPERLTPHALNHGIAAARGRVIVRMDVHSTYPPHYLRRLVEVLEANPEAGNVGGVCRILPGADTAWARAIAAAQSSKFGMGGIDWRRGGGEIRSVDTVPFGCFRREALEQVGLFDLDMVRNQDDELNGRLLRAGWKILLVPDVVIEYSARPTLARLGRMFWQYGLFKPLVWRKLGRPATLRQFAPPAMALWLAASFLATLVWPIWGLCGLLAWSTIYLVAGHLSAREVSDAVAGWRLAMVIACIHLHYGFGYLAGAVRFGLLRQPPPKLQPTR